MSERITLGAADEVQFKDAMAMMAAAVKVVATDGPAGRAGLTVTAACSVCQEPPRLLVCVNTNASAHPVVQRNAMLTLNILAIDQQDIAMAFAGKVAQQQRFAVGEWAGDELGQPALRGACARFSCSVHETLLSGTHTIFICDVHFASGNRDKLPLVYFDRNMTSIAQVA